LPAQVTPQSIPVKTPEGLDELTKRQRGLSQRQRMVLFLVDGRRDLAQVQQMAAAAGASESILVELLDLGFVSLREPGDTTTGSASPSATAESLDATEGSAVNVQLDAQGGSITAQKPTGSPSQQVPVLKAVVEGYTTLQQATEQDAFLDPAHPLNQAREMLLRALMEHAPVAGSITRMRVKRAQSIAEIAALLDEVERHISKPKRQLVTQQLISNVKQLLILAGSR
jgi:antitoxin component of MazEF toxin-antitoxin module